MNDLPMQLALGAVFRRETSPQQRNYREGCSLRTPSHSPGVLGRGHLPLISSSPPRQLRAEQRLWESPQALQRPSAALRHVGGRPGVRLAPGWSWEVTALELTEAGPHAPRLRNGQGHSSTRGSRGRVHPAWQQQSEMGCLVPTLPSWSPRRLVASVPPRRGADGRTPHTPTPPAPLQTPPVPQVALTPGALAFECLCPENSGT